MTKVNKIVLASTSPRRKALLNQIGISYLVADPGNVEESRENDPVLRVRENAIAKAMSVGRSKKTGVIIGADTIVVKDDIILEKPCGVEEARVMLDMLRGENHTVCTGVAVYEADSERLEVSLEETIVHMRDFSNHELDVYIDTGESFGKAGGYAIQGLGALLIESISGCYNNVVGLPLSKLHEILMRFDINILEKRDLNS